MDTIHGYLHALKDDQAGRPAIKVNDQYRITFRWEGHDAYDVCCEDYHQAGEPPA